jgi:glucose/arabinose dehydrogenase
MRIDDPQWNHNGTTLVFDPAGLLYIPIGDGGAGNDMGPGHSPQGNGQDLTKPFAKVLRIDPLGKIGAKVASGAYSVPADNPLVGKDGLDEIYAWGCRNIWGMSYDAPTGRMIAADVGQAKLEEVNVITAGNFGWPVKEGTLYFIRSGDQLGQVSSTPPADAKDAGPMIDPVAQYDHDEGTSITGGYVYRGKAVAELAGLYVFGDWKTAAKEDNSGRLFAANLETGVIEELLIGGKKPGVFVRAFGRDAAGELYVLSSTKVGPEGKTGAVHRIVKP